MQRVHGRAADVLSAVPGRTALWPLPRVPPPPAGRQGNLGDVPPVLNGTRPGDPGALAGLELSGAQTAWRAARSASKAPRLGDVLPPLTGVDNTSSGYAEDHGHGQASVLVTRAEVCHASVTRAPAVESGVCGTDRRPTGTTVRTRPVGDEWYKFDGLYVPQNEKALADGRPRKHPTGRTPHRAAVTTHGSAATPRPLCPSGRGTQSRARRVDTTDAGCPDGCA